MTKYLMTGDAHGDLSFMSRMVKVADAHKISTIIQLGDFGIWPGKEGRYYLDTLNDNASAKNVTVVFVPGNHEDYHQLEQYTNLANHGGWLTEEGFVPIRDNIFYTGKVNDWLWEGVKFKAVGGAHSIDKSWRTPGESWWWQETLTDEELDYAKQLGEADVLLTHDCPTYAPFKHRLKNDPESHIHRQKIDEVVHSTKAQMHFHGHMHDWYDYANHWGGKIYGLECNDEAMFDPYEKIKNHVIFDTSDYSVSLPYGE